jgi:mutator protein MutT
VGEIHSEISKLNFMNNKRSSPIVAVRAIIPSGVKKILLLKRESNDAFGNLWCLPGGKIEFGQTAKEALTREIKEETSLKCSSARFLFYQDGLPQNAGENHYLTLYFQCQANGEIQLNQESSEFVWIGQDEIDKYNIAFKNDEAIKKYWKDRYVV